MTENRPTPEQLLEQVEKEEARKGRGRLKVFLGYASGVGKSFKMLDEGRRRRERGEDVVVAAVQLKGPGDLEDLLLKHEIIPTKIIDGRQTVDLPEILRRRPQVVLVDGLAFDNPPGSRHEKRWQDVEEILDAGISVVTSVNLQYVAELRDEVAAITGKRPSETVPRSFIEKADEIVIADVPALEGVDRDKLNRLREMTLLLAAEVIDRQLQSYLRSHGIEEVWGTQERIMVCVTPRSSAREILESGRRNAERFHGELIAVYVRQGGLSPEDQAAVDKNLDIARGVGARVETLEGHDYVRTLVRFARSHGVTQIFIGHSQRQGWWHRLRGNPVERLIAFAEGIDVRVFPQKVAR